MNIRENDPTEEAYEPLPTHLPAEARTDIERLMQPTHHIPADHARAPWAYAAPWPETLSNSINLGRWFTASTTGPVPPEIAEVLNDGVDRNLRECVWAVLDYLAATVTSETLQFAAIVTDEPQARRGAGYARMAKSSHALHRQRHPMDEAVAAALGRTVDADPRQVWDDVLAVVEELMDLGGL